MLNPQNSSRTARVRPTRAECCTDFDCPSGMRNNYFIGKRLTPDAFQVEQNYLNGRRHLLNRAVFGWGVVYGFPVKAASPAPYEQQGPSGRLQIGPGLALDQPGRELIQTGTIELGLADMILLEQMGGQNHTSLGSQGATNPVPYRSISKPGPDADQGCWLLSVHYAEQDIGPVTVRDPCRCERQEWDRLCETVRYSLRQIDCRECCVERECELQCGCATDYCHDMTADEAVARPNTDDCAQRSCNPVPRGRQCLCDYLTNLDLDPDCDGLEEVEETCGRVRVDLRHGVPLACVRLSRDPCSDWIFDTWLEVCGPRRLVKRNDVLFDLIQGCDLTRICEIGWAPWHRNATPVSWIDFVRSFGSEGTHGKIVTKDYWVEFSRPVYGNTVRPDCFSMTLLVTELEGGWRQAWRVPIIGVVTEGPPGIASGLITKATLVVDARWVDDAKSRCSEGWVEIEVLGDYIVDCNGQTVDANPVGLSPTPTGNGTPGGTFTSKFRLGARGLPTLKTEQQA